MLLQRLCEYGETHQERFPPTGYKDGWVRWAIDLHPDGEIAAPTPVPLGEESLGRKLLVPHVGTRTVNVKAALLVDKAEYALGLYRDARTAERHEAFVELVAQCARETKEQPVEAVYKFLQRFDPLNPPWGDTQVCEPADVVTFRINDTMPQDLPAVREFWAEEFWRRLEDSDRASDRELTCLVCGRRTRPVRRHPYKIPGIPGGQTAGNVLVSANLDSFVSYGLPESYGAPCCPRCVEAYSNAAIDLIRGPDSDYTRWVVGPVLYVFWARSGVDFSPKTVLQAPEVDEVEALLREDQTEGGHEVRPSEVKALFRSPKKPGEYTQVDADAFYAAGMTASGGRVVVRDFVETTVGRVRRNVARWFRLQRLIGADGVPFPPLSVWHLAAGLYREPSREMIARVPHEMVDVALNGGRLPMWLLAAAVRRQRADRRGGGRGDFGWESRLRARTALMKMVLLSQNSRLEEDCMQELDPSNASPAYLCGRLLAEIESIQRAAIPGAQSTVTDRYFGAASSTPAAVFGHLLRSARIHLGKLRRDKAKRGLSGYFDRRLEDICRGMEGFPSTLSLPEQAEFNLGYFHQRTAKRESVSDSHLLQSGEAGTVDTKDEEGQQ